MTFLWSKCGRGIKSPLQKENSASQLIERWNYWREKKCRSFFCYLETKTSMHWKQSFLEILYCNLLIIQTSASVNLFMQYLLIKMDSFQFLYFGTCITLRLGRLSKRFRLCWAFEVAEIHGLSFPGRDIHVTLPMIWVTLFQALEVYKSPLPCVQDRKVAPVASNSSIAIRGRFRKYCRCQNAPCKLPLPLAIGALLGSDRNTIHLYLLRWSLWFLKQLVMLFSR